MKSIIKAVENQKQKKALEKESVRQREMQQEGVIEKEGEQEWEQVDGVVGQDMTRREAPPAYEKIGLKA